MDAKDSKPNEDRTKVRRLIDALEKQNWKVYWDEELPSGEPDWQATLERELKEAFGVVVVWSEDSVTSGLVAKEARAGRDMTQPYAASIDGVDIPVEFARPWAINLSDWDGNLDDPRIGELLKWPNALALFYTGLDRPILVMRAVRFKSPTNYDSIE